MYRDYGISQNRPLWFDVHEDKRTSLEGDPRDSKYWQEDEEEDVRSYWMTLRTGEDILIWRRRLCIALCGDIVLEEALDLSSDRILNEWMNPKCIARSFADPGLLRMRVRIPPGAWLFVSCVCCVVRVAATSTDRSLAPRSPTECGVFVCDLETSLIRRPRLEQGCCFIGREMYCSCWRISLY